ncbi:glutamate--cysteine ligase [Pseudaquabacterium rugosum]|uniref:Glutamate--cysteine ligase n=1 Tax=Pseudaquabacterium rugosum TaxID=2984194 RepID=A0ABU9BC89_9BURK
MTALHARAQSLTPAQLRGMRCGLEKESLRSLPGGGLALTPHPAALGSALTHPHITTDYSESQLELITGVHGDAADALAELTELHQAVYHALGRGDEAERLWVGSMPCGLPTDETIPLARYGNSHIGRAKSIYRMGLGHRYGRRMQTISGIHYNWSLPGLDNAQHFALIRNFRRHAFLLLWLFGASPAVCSDFVADRPHELVPLRDGSPTLHGPWATSLRMGRLGYQSEAQASLAVSYNCLERYADSLHDALVRPWPAYETVGVRNPGGDYNQLATSLLQIENEFYGLIRPKRVIRQGERPLHALRERGVEYIEVRCMDLDPFVDVGIAESTMHFLDIFLLHCLLADSPPDTPEEIRALGRNQHRTAARGREPGLLLERGDDTLPLVDWAAQLLDEMVPIAARLDETRGGDDHGRALAAARAALDDPAGLPSARVLQALQQPSGCCYNTFITQRAEQIRARLLALPWTAAQAREHAMQAEASRAAQARIDAAPQDGDFERWRLAYVDPARLQVQATAAEPAVAAAAVAVDG